MPIDIFRWLGLEGTPRAVRKPAGRTRTTGPFGEVVDCDTLQCVHCGCHWEVVAGSGKQRGYCARCDGYVCGGAVCMAACVPFERRLENAEAGRPVLTPPPVQITVVETVRSEPRPPE